MFAEKYLNPEHYRDGRDPGDDQCAFTGHDNEICGWAALPPMRDTIGMPQGQTEDDERGRFGSAHAGTMNAAMCDGSVHAISYSINSAADANNPGVHQRLANRHDGLPAESNAADAM
jgi:prepilin-type processing-associated H-X9-DG protein